MHSFWRNVTREEKWNNSHSSQHTPLHTAHIKQNTSHRLRLCAAHIS